MRAVLFVVINLALFLSVFAAIRNYFPTPKQGYWDLLVLGAGSTAHLWYARKETPVFDVAVVVVSLLINLYVGLTYVIGVLHDSW
jgi:hypothetical protein